MLNNNKKKGRRRKKKLNDESFQRGWSKEAKCALSEPLNNFFFGEMTRKKKKVGFLSSFLTRCCSLLHPKKKIVTEAFQPKSISA